MEKKKICTKVDKETAIFLYSIAKANDKTIGEIIDLIVREWGTRMQKDMEHTTDM